MHDKSTAGPAAASRERDTAYTTVRADIVELVPSDAHTILDVGCSNGTLGNTLKRMAPARSVSGIELDAAFASEAAKTLDHVFNGDLNRLDWEEALGDRKFDCIIFADVLEHLIDPSRCLRAALKFLSPGGCIVVSLPNVRHISALWVIFVKGHFPRRDRGIFDRTHLHWFTLHDSVSLLGNCGLKVSASTQALRWGDRGGGRFNKLLNRLPMRIQQWAPIREFLTYQICIRAEAVA